MHALQGSMAMQLQGCGVSDDSGGSWFQFAFLSAWTPFLAIQHEQVCLCATTTGAKYTECGQ